MAKAKTIAENEWNFVESLYEPELTQAQIDSGRTVKAYDTAGFWGDTNRYWTERRPMLKAVTFWRDMLSMMDHKANRDKIRKFVAGQEKTTIVKNVAANKVAEKTGSNKANNAMSAEMLAQIAEVVRAVNAESEE